MSDAINPKHYKSRAVECIDVVESMSFCLGNAVKYVWRMGQKGDAVEDLKKAAWYFERAIKRNEVLGGACAQHEVTRVLKDEPEDSLLNQVLCNIMDGSIRLALVCVEAEIKKRQ